jgi:23S rRNA (adenine2503-C2)-methyltransferase
METLYRQIDPTVSPGLPVLSLLGMKREDLETVCSDLGAPVVHSRTLMRSLFKDFSPEPWTMPSIPKVLARHLEACATPPEQVCVPTEAHVSQYDLSVKFLMTLADGRQVETVLMPESRRITLCVSSQVGCAQACTFCHTGRMGLLRQLTAAEIVGQFWTASRWMATHPEWREMLGRATQLDADNLSITNIVFMGMGEPLDNVPAVAQAIEILTDPLGPGLALRRISVSTAGHLDGLEELLRRIPDARIALSVHSPEDRERSRIMPINRRWPLSQVLERLRQLHANKDHAVMLQYTLIRGVNDGVEHAIKLAQLTEGLQVKVNLIPLNAVGPSRFQGPSPEQLGAFRDALHHAGLRVMVRYSKGQDIAAGCGQLVVASTADTSSATPFVNSDKIH